MDEDEDDAQQFINDALSHSIDSFAHSALSTHSPKKQDNQQLSELLKTKLKSVPEQFQDKQIIRVMGELSQIAEESLSKKNNSLHDYIQQLQSRIQNENEMFSSRESTHHFSHFIDNSSSAYMAPNSLLESIRMPPSAD